MKKTLLISFLLLGLCSKAQINFLNNNIIDTSYCISSVTHVIAFDIDNDGDLDIIAASDSNYIVWQENLDGLGNYGNIHLITDQLNGITSISLADIDNDGDMDVVSSSKTDGIIAWHENLGQGNFTIHILASGLTGASSAKAGDINGDGFIDIVANTNYGNVGWFKNTNGLGNFNAALPIGTGLQIVSSIDIQDADGDGDKDIVVNSMKADQFIRVGLFTNTNALGAFGSFQLLKNVVPELNYSIVSKVLFQDIDNDGDYDILFSANNQIIKLINSGTGLFPTITNIYNGDIRDRIADFKMKDMDNDSDLDLVAAIRLFPTGEKVEWFENDNAHTYATSTIIQDFTLNDIRTFEIADIDGDNIKDIVTGNYSNNYIVWYKNYTTIKSLGKNCFDPAVLLTADLDNDGDLDFITTTTSGTSLVWYENTDGAGTPGLQKVITFQDACYGYALGDIDGDGFIDIVISGKWFKNDGLGNFTANTYVTASSPNKIYIEDIDNDGKNDLLMFTNGGNGNTSVGWYKNVDGLGNFAAWQTIMNNNNLYINNLVFADIDADGDKDILFSGGRIGLIKNLNGAGTFDTTIQNIYVFSCTQIFCVDMDGDGDLDILADDVVVNGEVGVGWFKNIDGLGTIPNLPIKVGNSAITGAFPADLDNDGDLDVVTTDRYGTNTLWVENINGLGLFGPPTIIVVNEFSNNTNSAVDVNNDGKIDILYSNSFGKNEVSWFKNNGLSLNKITGTIKFDLNSNACGTGANPMDNVKVITQTSTSDTYSTFTSSNGYYQFYVDGPGDYTTSVATTLPSYFTVNPESYETTFTSINSVQTLDFCVTGNQVVNDLEVALYPITEARPGFINTYRLVYRNKGTTQLSGNVKLQFNPLQMSSSSAFPAASSQTTNELTFNFTNINPFETRTVALAFQTFTSVNLADILNFTGTISPITGDATPIDNVFQLNQLVVGSYDPNDINVLEGESILADEVPNYLHYVIRFQNIGTASAINVVVENTLDDTLDWNTLQLDTTSHSNYSIIRNGNQISFVFNGIYLPSIVTNEAASQGYICYKIKPKSTSVVGDIFYNDAKIYFDYNAAIHTNTVSTEVLSPLTTPDFETNKVTLYPNPTNGKLNISVNFEVKSIAVYSIYGQQVALISNNNEIDLSNCADGIYFVTIEDTTGKTITKKIIKR